MTQEEIDRLYERIMETYEPASAIYEATVDAMRPVRFVTTNHTNVDWSYEPDDGTDLPA